MADLDDVTEALRLKVIAALDAAAVDLNYVVFGGWPLPNELERDLNAKISNISIFTDKHGERTVPTRPMGFVQVDDPVVNLVATASNSQLRGGSPSAASSATVTLTGSVNSGLVVQVKVGSLVVAYKPVAGNTLTQAATGLAAALNANTDFAAAYVASAVGAVVTVSTISHATENDAIAFGVSVGGTANLMKETGRANRVYEVHVWTYDPEARKLLADTVNDDFLENRIIVLADGSDARLTYDREVQTDREEKHGVYRRTLYYRVEYARTRKIQGTQVLEGTATIETP